VNGDVTVDAKAQTAGVGDASANARAEIAAESGEGLLSPSSAGGQVVVDGNVDVTASANMLGGEGGHALACASLDIDATFGTFGGINVNGDVSVNAFALDSGHGSAQANAFAGLDAEGSVNVNGDVGVHATADQLNESGGNALACADLEMSAS